MKVYRIKDNVDLKELEKFGFEYDSTQDNYVKEISTQLVRWGREHIKIIIDKNKKISKFNKLQHFGIGSLILSWRMKLKRRDIKDLIKAKIVEKVSD